ncbi:hypothetical protein D9M69_723670 [compost metagenome]
MARARSVIDGVPARAMCIRIECCDTFNPQGASTASYSCDTRRVALRSAAPLQTSGSGALNGAAGDGRSGMTGSERGADTGKGLTLTPGSVRV